MAYANIMNSSFLLTAANQACPNATVVGSTVGSIVSNGSGIQTSALASNRRYAYTQRGWNGAIGWSGARPRMIKAISSNNSSTFPPFNNTTSTIFPIIEDLLINITAFTASNACASIESALHGFNATVTGTKMFWSVYWQSGSKNASASNSLFGWGDPTVIATQGMTLASNGWIASNGGGGRAIQGWRIDSSTSVYFTDSTVDQSVTTSGFSVPYDDVIVSVGWDTTTPTAPVMWIWQHNASTGALIASQSKTTSNNTLTTSTNVVPYAVWYQPTPPTTPFARIMTVGYPTISGFSYFYNQ